MLSWQSEPSSGYCLTYRSLDLIPIPQDTLQADQLIHSDIIHVDGSVHREKKKKHNSDADHTTDTNRRTSRHFLYVSLKWQNGKGCMMQRFSTNYRQQTLWLVLWASDKYTVRVWKVGKLSSLKNLVLHTSQSLSFNCSFYSLGFFLLHTFSQPCAGLLVPHETGWPYDIMVTL